MSKVTLTSFSKSTMQLLKKKESHGTWEVNKETLC
jgi:hypothetical protein